MNRVSPSCPEQLLIESARRYARSVTARRLTRISLTLEDGTKRKIDIAPTREDEWPPLTGWAVDGDRAALNGLTFRLGGKPLAVFRTLVEVGADGISPADLKRLVWDEHTETRTVENTMSKLRALIREGLGMRESIDPIIAERERYRLALLDRA